LAGVTIRARPLAQRSRIIPFWTALKEFPERDVRTTPARPAAGYGHYNLLWKEQESTGDESPQCSGFEKAARLLRQTGRYPGSGPLSLGCVCWQLLREGWMTA